MRHRKSGRKLGRNQSHRDAMFRNMVTSLLSEEKIQTTTAKAKELRRVAERLITIGKRNASSVVEAASDDTERERRVAARVAGVRQAGKTVHDRVILQKLFGELAERYQDREGGYTRIMRLGNRLGDNAELAIIELMPPSGDAGSAAQDAGAEQSAEG
ncbi:MAG: 50S ribosomal protein L17 [Myxococcales bacterium]|nr:50S ribosomal protein L17 [Myxococcales bacterium]MCB9547397.1 50S ribosomal protein L17 [Myxococcales bacterium]